MIIWILSRVLGATHTRTIENMEKAKKTLDMSTDKCIKKQGLNRKTCCLIYWSIVFSTLSFGCEMRAIKTKYIEVLTDFQRYAARCWQRLRPRSLNSTSMACLGWMDIMDVIKAKKRISIRTIVCIKEYNSIRKIFMERLSKDQFGSSNVHELSPMVQILDICHEFQLIEGVRNTFNGILIG